MRKKYIFNPNVLIRNLKKAGEILLVIAVFLAMGCTPTAWL